MHISVFCGASLPHSEQITEATRQLGRAIARGGHTLLYGGSNLGLMGATSGAALQEGGRVVGVIPTFFSDDIIHSISQGVTICPHPLASIGSRLFIVFM